MSLRTSRVWATPPEIFRTEMTGGAYLDYAIKGRKFLLRSDFPVLCYIDGVLYAQVGAPFFAPAYRFELGRLAGEDHQVRFRLPTGWGGGADSSYAGAHALVQSEVLGRHGTCCLDSAWTDEIELLIPDPDLLPTCVFTLSTLAVTAGTVNPNWGTQTQAAAQFTLTGNRMPNEFYVKTVSLDVEHAPTYQPLAGIYCYEWQLRKTNVPAADLQYFFQLTQTQSSVEHYVQNYKMPLRSLFSPWAAETPTLDMIAFGSIDPLIAPVVHARLEGSYIL